MAYTLNTSHPLYANLVELIGVQSGALVSHKTARTFTKHADASYTSGTYGEAFHSLEAGYTAKGATFSPAIAVNTAANPNTTVFVVINSAGASTGYGHLISGVAGPSVGINDTSVIVSRGVADAVAGYTGDATTGTAHSIAFTRTGETASQVYLDKTSIGSGAGLGYNSSAAELSAIGGASGFSSIAADIVWVAVFNKVLSAAEISDLHDSLGASNAFGLVAGASTNGTASGTPDTLDLIAPTASASGTGGANGSASGSPSVASITAPAATATGTTAGSGTITTPALKNNTGTILASISGWTVNVYNASTGALVVQKTGLATSAVGVLTVTDAAIATGTTYAYEPVHATYGRRLPTGAAS